MMSIRQLWTWVFLLALSLGLDSLCVTAIRLPSSLLRLSTRDPLAISENSVKEKNTVGNRKFWRANKTTVAEEDSKDDDDDDEPSSSDTSSSSDSPSSEQDKSWKQTRKPVPENVSSTRGSTRLSIPRFGLIKNKKSGDKTSNDENAGTCTVPQSERAKRQQERKEKAEKQNEEKEQKQKSGKSRYERAQEARKERNKVDSSSNNTNTDVKPSSNETAAASSANVTSTNTATTRQHPQQQIPAYITGIGNSNNGGPPIMYRSPPPRQQALRPNQALAVTAVVSLLTVVSRLWIVVWITKQLGSEEDLIHPVQHFVWECLNDRYTKDEVVLTQALSRPPSGYSKTQWNKYLKSLKPPKTEEAKKMKKMPIPTKTTVVVNITPNNQLDLSYLADVVNFLTKVHASLGFGQAVEVVLLLRSPGGPVTTYGLAAAHVARLEQAGMNTTVCVDDVAASGGYMIASQTAKIVAAPFAMVGSIGVIREGLNFNKLLETYGVKPLVIKAGDSKNPLSALGPVTQKEIEEETKRLEEVHESFIELCRNQRPMLDPAVCDGTVLLANRALASGMVDRVLTSDEYIWERICDGDYVLKLHRTHRTDQRRVFARALDVLPHLRQLIKNTDMQMLTSRVLQGVAFASMLRNNLFKDL